MKQITKVLFFSILLYLSCAMKATAQANFYPLLTMGITVTGIDTLPGGGINLSDTAFFNVHIKIYLVDTNAISKIWVSLRVNAGSPNLLQQSFDFSSVNRNGRTINIDLGNYRGQHYYGEARIEKTDSSLTDAFKSWL